MLKVAIASRDLANSAQLLANLEQTGLAVVTKQWSIPVERITEPAETMPDVVFLDLTREVDQSFAFAAQLRRNKPSIKVVACSDTFPPNPQMMLEAMRSGVQDFLSKPVEARALKDMLLRIKQDTEIVEVPSGEKLVVVMGSKGGVGTTTVAVNLGVQLASFAKKRTILLDLAQPLGNVHLLLDLAPKFNVRDAAENLNRLDSHFFSGLLTHHKSKLEVLCGVSQPEEWQRIDVSLLERMVNVAQHTADIVLVDMGSQFSSEWSSVFQMARMILLVAEANVPSLWTLERRLMALKGFGVQPDRAKVIINRWHKGDEEVLKSIQKNIGRPIFACLPNDFRKASNAVNLGTPIEANNHNNALSLRYRQISAQLVGTSLPPDPKKGPLSGLFSFSSKG
jgi:pilus assembly protein CpaE